MTLPPVALTKPRENAIDFLPKYIVIKEPIIKSNDCCDLLVVLYVLP